MSGFPEGKDYGPFEHHVMPSGTECFYRDSNHSYYRYITPKKGKEDEWVGPNDARIPSPSSVGSVLDLDKADRLMRWAARHPDAIGFRDKRAEEGTKIHEDIFEALAKGEGIPSLADVDEDARGRAQGVLAFWRDFEPEAIASEAVVYSETHGFAGRLDLLAEIDGKRVIVDLKTSKYIGEGMHTQLAGYVLAAEESGYGPIDSALLLKVNEDGSYDTYPCVATFQDFIAALNAYRAGKELKKALTMVKEMEEGDILLVGAVVPAGKVALVDGSRGGCSARVPEL